MYKNVYVECWLFGGLGGNASGLCYATDGCLYGVTVSYNKTGATATIKRLM